jgi:hypothetical protein
MVFDRFDASYFGFNDRELVVLHLGSVTVLFAAAPEPVFAGGKARDAMFGCSK